METGEKLRFLRETQNRTIEEVAAELSVHPVTLSQYERGTRGAPYDFLKRAVPALGMSWARFDQDETWEQIDQARAEAVAAVLRIIRGGEPVGPGPRAPQGSGDKAPKKSAQRQNTPASGRNVGSKFRYLTLYSPLPEPVPAGVSGRHAVLLAHMGERTAA